MLCLVADELVLGDLGELGPLDAQCDERQQADFPLNTSRLALFKALEQLQAMALDAYEDAVQRVVKGSRMSPFDAGTKAAEVTASLYGPIYAKIDPIRVAEGARGLEVGSSYALRILARHRPDIPAERHGELVHRLIHAYPSHGFVIDADELARPRAFPRGRPTQPSGPSSTRRHSRSRCTAIRETSSSSSTEPTCRMHGRGRIRRLLRSQATTATGAAP